MTSFRETSRLSVYEECAGPLGGLTDQDGTLIALIGKIHLALPAELEKSLRPLIGKSITIIKTDLRQKEYIFRVLAPKPNCEQKEDHRLMQYE